MSCVDFMYQFYSPYFSYKSTADDTQKYGSQPSIYDSGITGPGPSNFLDNGLLPEKESRDLDKSSQPKSTHYLTSNCVLLTYFSGETAAVVDEHFSRALSQPSSYTIDKTLPNNKLYTSRADTPLMCHRKLPPSFWNSSYQPSCSNNSNSFSSLGADAYFQSSLYNLHKTWPYHYSPQPHSYPAHQSALAYPGMDTPGRLTSHYGSLMMPGPSLSARMGESRHHGQYEWTKSSDTFSGYYGMGRFGSEMETSLPGLDLPLQQAKKEHYW
ncbi:transcription cofactor vestigial-like protein 2 [Biomphalaria glabrata]|uniref:Transcription cofactor vestigial-like protein 2 n=2 Tax=Biomphalaria glabrata TaxID=6526 RepID=A0A9U8DU22_BIOGL|nr:transcription cofactor vestigial-like protein 2 [Biomphalaria glabrata]KAI8791423.1 transcription cofactor vestigial protein 2 [Biomphalaria glabrata]